MKTDILKHYVSARNALRDEKAQLEARLQQINQALTSAPSTAIPAPKPAAQRTHRTRSPISMKAAVVQVTTGHPMTKPEILAAIQELGHRSTSKHPVRMLDNLLYGKNPRFKNDNGRFSPRSTARRSASAKPMTKTAKPSAGRKLSAAARANRAASMKTRWAKIKKAGGKRLRAV